MSRRLGRASSRNSRVLPSLFEWFEHAAGGRHRDEKMPDDGCATVALEISRALLDGRIVESRSIHLPQVFTPRLDEERFAEMAGLGEVVQQHPAHAAVAQPNRAHRLHQLSKFFGRLWLDLV